MPERGAVTGPTDRASGLKRGADASTSLFPYRAEISLTFPAGSTEDAAQFLAQMVETLEPWAFFEGASCERMNDADVIPDSPLAEAMGRE